MLQYRAFFCIIIMVCACVVHSANYKQIVVVLGFYVPPTAKVIWRRDLGLKSHPKDWRSPGSNSGPLVYKAGSLTARPRRLPKQIGSFSLLACLVTVKHGKMGFVGFWSLGMEEKNTCLKMWVFTKTKIVLSPSPGDPHLNQMLVCVSNFPTLS